MSSSCGLTETYLAYMGLFALSLSHGGYSPLLGNGAETGLRLGSRTYLPKAPHIAFDVTGYAFVYEFDILSSASVSGSKSCKNQV